MARIRTLKPEFPQSESMGKVSRDARLLFVELWTLCDDAGRTRAVSRMLASLLFPYDDDAPKLIDGWLKELEREGCIVFYEVEGSKYLQVCNWLKHQKIDHPSKSNIPAFDASSRGLSKPREDSGLDQGPRTKDQGEEKASSSTPVSQAPAVISIPTNRKQDFPITQQQVDEFSSAYPAVDVMQELRQMRAWSIANPSKCKTAKGMLRFVNTWLSRRQDNPTSKPNGSAHTPDYMVGAI